MDSGTKPMTPGQAVWLYKSILMHGEESWRKWIELGRWVHERRRPGRRQGARHPRPHLRGAVETLARAIPPNFPETKQQRHAVGAVALHRQPRNGRSVSQSLGRRRSPQPSADKSGGRMRRACVRASTSRRPRPEVAAAADAEGDEERAGRMPR